MKTPPAVTIATATHSSELVRSRNRTRSRTATNSGLMVTNTSEDNTEVIDSDVTHRAKCTARNAPASILHLDTVPFALRLLHFGTVPFSLRLLHLRHICNGRSRSVDSANRQHEPCPGSGVGSTSTLLSRRCSHAI